MSGFIRFVMISCIAFTISFAFYLFFSYLSIFPTLDNQMGLNILLISLTITILMFAKKQFPINHPIISRLLELGIVIFVLLIAGIFFQLFPLIWRNALFVCLSGFLTYIGVMVVAYIGNLLSAQEINSVIAKKKRRMTDE
ncbi:permeases of the major facilitator superfamily [Bacillus sp. OxB-1]|uniref:hypothetical protein n=1 Tax=Bacillus sp. (strain OxB-1) TaxID=98228 RepID=UPI000581E2FB|nr:hypothetical protein [Bacillus sp. OxB-1]BAQ10987.1 permeases of the major facilitator superfamily [Bacillus sp. OxB-1]